MSVHVERASPLATLRDMGRPGTQHLGLGPGGASDPFSHRIANLLVGNGPEAATLEVALAGPVLRFAVPTLAALCGADLSATLDGIPVPLWRPLWIRPGARLAFGAARAGARAYLAVAGGFLGEEVLGSRSPGPGLGLAPPGAGDVLPMGPQPPFYPRLRMALGAGAPFAAPAWFAPFHRDLDLGRPAVLRLLAGPQLEVLDAASREALFGEVFTVGPRSDGMGLRLDGPRLVLARPLEMISAPVATGTLQLPPGGSPILLLAGRQTTGGYPRLGEVASVDHPAAAQLRAGEALRLRACEPGEAMALLREREARLRALEEGLRRRMEAPDGA
ncbi:MAG TPA: biotin-dependent carboxyltransferase family protein [Holophaga sp.]|nr:biotin-dependent carboxyltransferase family protein [Holophaga sp.]